MSAALCARVTQTPMIGMEPIDKEKSKLKVVEMKNSKTVRQLSEQPLQLYGSQTGKWNWKMVWKF